MSYIVGVVHGQGFARIFTVSAFTHNAADHEAVSLMGRNLVMKGFTILNQAMADKDYVAGYFSVADPVLFYVEFWADKTGIPIPPHLLAHYRRLLQRPTVQRVLREEGYNPATLGQQRAP